MITGINKWKKLTRDILCECKCKSDGTKCNSNQYWNNDKCRCEFKKVYVCEKNYAWNPAKCVCKNGKYLASIMDESAITCDEVMNSYDEEIKTIPTNFNDKNL